MHLKTTNNTEPIRTVSYTYTTSIKTMNKILAKNRTQARRPLCICEMTPRKPKTKRTKFKRITYGSRYYFQILKRLLFKMKKKRRKTTIDGTYVIGAIAIRSATITSFNCSIIIPCDDHCSVNWIMYGRNWTGLALSTEHVLLFQMHRTDMIRHRKNHTPDGYISYTKCQEQAQNIEERSRNNISSC